MYCPNCSTQAEVEQKFCRSCGMELQAVGDLIRDQVNIAATEEPKEEFFHGNKRALVIWGMILTFLAIAFGSSLKLLAKEHIELAGEFTPYLLVITVVAAFCGMGMMSYPFLQMITGKRTSPKQKLPKSGATNKLGRPALLADEQPSVTEQTTEFLEASEARIKGQDTAPQNE